VLTIIPTLSANDTNGAIITVMAKVDGSCDSGFAIISEVISKITDIEYALKDYFFAA
jgi:hypothetical protein